MPKNNQLDDRMAETDWIRMGSEEAITAVGGAARWVDGVVEKERAGAMESYQQFQKSRVTCIDPNDLKQLVSRLTCKAEACRVACCESQPETRDPLRRWRCEDMAKVLGVDAWMLRPQVVHCGASVELAVLADCADATAAATESLYTVTRSAAGTPKHRMTAIDNLAEAQSMMRVANLSLQKSVPGFKIRADRDQEAAFGVLTSTAKKNHHYVEQYGRERDQADPAKVEMLLAKIATLNNEVRAVECSRCLVR